MANKLRIKNGDTILAEGLDLSSEYTKTLLTSGKYCNNSITFESYSVVEPKPYIKFSSPTHSTVLSCSTYTEYTDNANSATLTGYANSSYEGMTFPISGLTLNKIYTLNLTYSFTGSSYSGSYYWGMYVGTSDISSYSSQPSSGYTKWTGYTSGTDYNVSYQFTATSTTMYFAVYASDLADYETHNIYLKNILFNSNTTLTVPYAHFNSTGLRTTQNLNYTSTFTWCAWVRITDTSGGTFRMYETGPNGYSWSWEEGKFSIMEHYGSSWYVRFETRTDAVYTTGNIWYFVCVDHDGSTSHVYINNELITSGSGYAGTSRYTSYSNIGAYYYGAWAMSGVADMGAYRMFSRVLTEAERTQLYEQNSRSGISDCYAEYLFDSNINDTSGNGYNLSFDNGNALTYGTASIEI